MSTNEWLRLPGPFRRWELEQVIEPGDDFHVEGEGPSATGSSEGPNGHAEDGSQLFAIYQRAHTAEEANDEARSRQAGTAGTRSRPVGAPGA